MRRRRSAEAPNGVGRHVRAHGCGLGTCKAHGRAVVEEVCGATEGERFVSGLFPEEFEEFDRLAMGEDVQEAQKLSMDTAGGGHDGWKEGQKSIGGCVCLTVFPDFGLGSGVEEHVGVSIAQLSVAAPVVPTIAREIVCHLHVDDKMGFACKIYVLNLQVALLSSTAGGDVAAARGEPASLDHLFQCGQNVLVCVFSGSTMLGASVRVVAERVEHETAAVAETLWPSQSRNKDAEELAEPRCPPIEGEGHDSVMLQ